jgi:hypothetical protein
MELNDLVEIERIKRLKYRYLRHLDLKQFDQLALCFAEDATASYNDGVWSFTGRDAIMEFLSTHGADRTSLHTAHHPEIEITGPDTAEATWTLQDIVFRPGGSQLLGAAHYHDTYVRTDGEWRIKSTGYTRIFERRTTLTGPPS